MQSSMATLHAMAKEVYASEQVRLRARVLRCSLCIGLATIAALWYAIGLHEGLPSEDVCMQQHVQRAAWRCNHLQAPVLTWLRLQLLRKLPGTSPGCECMLVRMRSLCATRVCPTELCVAGAQCCPNPAAEHWIDLLQSLNQRTPAGGMLKPSAYLATASFCNAYDST